VSSLVFESSTTSNETVELIGFFFWILLALIFFDIVVMKFRTKKSSEKSATLEFQPVQKETMVF
jgi:hypothetical protein